MALLTVAEAATRYGLSEGRIRQLVRSGQVRAQRVGARVLVVDERSLRAYVRKPHPPGPKPKGTTSGKRSHAGRRRA